MRQFLKNIRDKDKTNIAITIGQIKSYKKEKIYF